MNEPTGNRTEPWPSTDDTAMRYIWVVLLGVAVWLLFYRYDGGDRSGASSAVLWLLFSIILAVEAFRTWLVRKRPAHPAHRYFPFFDAFAIYLALKGTGGIYSELWLLYAFQLIAGAFSPEPRTLRILGLLVVVSYAAAVLPDVKAQDWNYFVSHLHLPFAPPPLPAQLPSAASEIERDAVPKLLTRFFFLFVLSGMSQAIARKRARQERDLALLREQVAVAEDRGRIARELHDSLNHTLIGSLLRLEVCRKLIHKSPGEVAGMLDEEKAALRSALDTMRDYVFHLRPAELGEEPLETLLRQYAGRFSERTGLEVDVEAEPLPDPRPAVRVAAARIVQEAMTNAAKHAKARRITVALRVGPGASMTVSVTDDGVGFDMKSVGRGGMGMECMRERAEVVGGRLEVDSAPGLGTTVKAVLPLK